MTNGLAVAMQVNVSSASVPIGQGWIGEGLSEGLIVKGSRKVKIQLDSIKVKYI